MLTAPSRTVSEARNETTSDISRLPKKKPVPGMSSGRRTTTNTPNTIIDRCSGTEKRHELCELSYSSGHKLMRLLPFSALIPTF
jgi:hypothetical protein